MKKIKVIHDRKKCIGCNFCKNIDPSNWTMNLKDGKSNLVGSKKKGEVYVGEVFECDLEKTETVIRSCPMQIIKIDKNSL